MCIAECPAKAIIPRGWDKNLLKHNTVKALESMDNDVKIVAYICGHRAPASAWRGENGAVAGVKEFYLPSMARLSTAELLNAFEGGADAVIVAACTEDFERYPQAAMRIRKRINQAREMLSEVGIDNQRLKIFEGGGDAESIRKILGQAAREVREIIS